MQKLKQDIIMLDQQYFILKQVDYESAKYIDNFFLLLFIAALSVFTLCSLMSTALFFFFPEQIVRKGSQMAWDRKQDTSQCVKAFHSWHSVSALMNPDNVARTRCLRKVQKLKE